LKRKHHYRGKLHIIGPEWDVTKLSLSALAEEQGVRDSVIFYGYLTPENMESALKRCGYFLSASSFEGFGMSMLEAMAVGLIPFVQPNGSFRELVAGGGAGACVDFSKPEEAAAFIAAHLEKITLQDRERARDYARQFSWEQLAQDTLESYRKYGNA
jgi:alpha-1,3-mannosyltransferase